MSRTPGELPGIGSITALAFVVVLVPAIVIAAVLHAVGASLGVSCMLGLLVAFIGMGFYPKVLKGWVGSRIAGAQLVSDRQASVGRIYAAYLGLRFVLFAAALAICILFGLSGLLAVIVALLVSGVVAYPLARRQREDIARAFQQRRTGRS